LHLVFFTCFLYARAVQFADQLPRTFQANADRFYLRVVVRTLGELPNHGALAIGEASDMNAFLDQCTAQVDNHTANEAAKAFALTLDGMFERQLTRWTAAHGATTIGWEGALKRAARIASLDLDTVGIAQDLNELHLVANVARHGEGGSCAKLQSLAPQLWDNPYQDYYDLAPGPVPASELLRIRLDDLRRYARAIARFWGHADPLPNAALDPPY
jgi:hypothetical protein